jgi:predicted DNA-binding transcriptional regulator AlpA
MKTFEFAIVASGLDPSADDFESRFYEAGCDDATVSFQRGHIIVDFAREADSVEDAIASALEDVALAGATVDRIEPDPLVSLADIAHRTGLTRAALTNYSKGKRAKAFPTPVARVTSDSPLWDWSAVSRWFYENRNGDRDVAVEAEAIRQANAAITLGVANIGELLRARVHEYEGAL